MVAFAAARSSDQGAKNRRFAIKQRHEIQSMGFSKSAANKIVRTAGPRLSAASVTWGTQAWNAAKERILREKERSKLSDEMNERERGFSTTTDDQVTFQLKQTIDCVLSEIQDISNPGTEGHKNAVLMARQHLKEYGLKLPDADIRNSVKMLEAAQIVADEIPELEKIGNE